MTRLKNSFASKSLVLWGVVIVVVLIGAMACQSAVAQGQRIPRRPTTPPDERPVRAVEQNVEPDAAEPEEGAPERQYKSLPVNELQKRQDSAVKAILREGKVDPAKKQMLDDFYTTYYLARWSLKENVANIANLAARGGYRQELFKQHLAIAKEAAHDYLNALVFDFMSKLIAGDFHPVVRINAMLTIGDLNSVEQTSRGAAVPLPEAFGYLITAVENKKLSDALRAAAMVGIQRHASANIQDQEVRKSLSIAMLRLATDDVPEGPNASGRAWIVSQALETLGILGSVGEGNVVYKAMLKTVGDSGMPFFARNAAADSMGRLDYSSANGINPVEAAVALGQLALDASVEETKNAGTPVSRRRLLRPLIAVRTAIVGEDDAHKGIASLAKENQQAFVAELQKTIQVAIDMLDDKKKESDDMAPVVESLRKNLEAWLQKKP